MPKKFQPKVKEGRKKVKVEIKEEIIIDNDELELEEIVQATPAMRAPRQKDNINPSLEMSENIQELETQLRDVPINNPQTNKQEDNAPRYQAASSAYQSAMNYETNSGNYDDQSGYPKRISTQPDNPFRLTSPWSGQSSMSPMLKPTDALASNQYPEQMDIKKYESSTDQRRRE